MTGAKQPATNNSVHTRTGTIPPIPMHVNIKISLPIFFRYLAYE